MLGGPGSGKTTACGRAAAALGYAHISTGELLRAAARTMPRGILGLPEMLAAGYLVWHDDVSRVFWRALKATPAGRRGYLIDGFPRTFFQMAEFEEKLGRPAAVVHLACGPDVMRARTRERGRGADDGAAVVERRIAAHEELLGTVLRTYRARGLLAEVDASGDAESVYTAFAAAVEAPVSAVEDPTALEYRCMALLKPTGMSHATGARCKNAFRLDVRGLCGDHRGREAPWMVPGPPPPYVPPPTREEEEAAYAAAEARKAELAATRADKGAVIRAKIVEALGGGCEGAGESALGNFLAGDMLAAPSKANRGAIAAVAGALGRAWRAVEASGLAAPSSTAGAGAGAAPPGGPLEDAVDPRTAQVSVFADAIARPPVVARVRAVGDDGWGKHFVRQCGDARSGARRRATHTPAPICALTGARRAAPMSWIIRMRELALKGRARDSGRITCRPLVWLCTAAPLWVAVMLQDFLVSPDLPLLARNMWARGSPVPRYLNQYPPLAKDGWCYGANQPPPRRTRSRGGGSSGPTGAARATTELGALAAPSG